MRKERAAARLSALVEGVGRITEQAIVALGGEVFVAEAATDSVLVGDFELGLQQSGGCVVFEPREVGVEVVAAARDSEAAMKTDRTLGDELRREKKQRQSEPAHGVNPNRLAANWGGK
jgi:hypothetical protein